MKKISLLLFACAAMFTTAMAQADTPAWPDSFSSTLVGFCWGGEVAPNPNVPTATFSGVSGSYLMAIPEEGDADFDALWDAIPDDAESLDKVNNGGAADGREDYGSWKATYDAEEECIIFLVSYIVPTGASYTGPGNKIEVMICPYYKLAGVSGASPNNAYLRFGIKGGNKFEMGSATDPTGYCFVTPDADGSAFGVSQSEPTHLKGVTPISVDLSTDGGAFQRIVIIPFAALNDAEAGTDFTLDVWKRINGGAGIAFNVKFMEQVLAGQDFSEKEYQWSTESNNVYYSNAEAGYLKAGDIVSSGFDVAVTNGTASPAKAAAGATVTITADAAADGKKFAAWTGENVSLLVDANAATTTFVMPANAVTFTATYETIGTEGAELNKIIIANGIISLGEAAAVEVYSASGILALSAYDVQVDISGLAAGAYIVKAAGQVVKFVK